jgi:hypothetical protein
MSQGKVLAALSAAAVVLISATPVAARNLPDGGMTANELSGWLIGKGMPAQVKPDPTTPGDQIVSTSADGVNVDIYLYDCSGAGDARRCTSMQYASGWQASSNYNTDRINEWDRTHRYIRAYLTKGNSLYGEYDLDLSPGGTYEMLDDSLQNWRSTVRDFKAFFDL